MTNVPQSGINCLSSAADAAARIEIDRIAQKVIEELRFGNATCIFEDEIEARNLWDEYCWSVQEGPFDDELSMGPSGHGTIASTFSEMIIGFVRREFDKLPHHARVFLHAYVFHDELINRDEDNPDTVWIEEVIDSIVWQIDRRASGQDMALIGPCRDDVFRTEAEGSGLVWSVIGEDEAARDLIVCYRSELLAEDGDLSGLASELTDLFIADVTERSEDFLFGELLNYFGEDMRQLIIGNDVLPMLGEMRRRLLKSMDGGATP